MKLLTKALMGVCLLTLVFSFPAISIAESDAIKQGYLSENEDVIKIFEDNTINEIAETDIEMMEVSEQPEAFVVNEDGMSVKIPKDLSDELTIKDDDSGVELHIKSHIDIEADVETADTAIVFHDENVAEAFEVFNGGVRQTFILNNEDAPKEFKIEYSADGLSYINKAYNESGETDGSLLLYGDDGEIIASVDPPWAKDNNGNNIETYYKINGTTITQVIIPDRNSVYPIIADPSTFSSYFDSGKWITRGSGAYKLSLSLKPKLITRVSYGTARGGWYYVWEKFHGSSNWSNTASIENQYLCHALGGLLQSEWDLEPKRPNVGLAQTINAFCNPT